MRALQKWLLRGLLFTAFLLAVLAGWLGSVLFRRN